jgi:predicted transcriptional regulator
MVSWQVVERILFAFYENGSLKKSQIALKSGLKYPTCMRYLRWLDEKMDFVKFELDSQDKHIESIRLTSQGISFCKNKLFENECMIKNNSEHTFA